MKIVDVQAFVLGYQRTQPSRFYRSFALIKVALTGGTVGWGEASDGYGHSMPLAVKALVEEELRRLVVGREVEDPGPLVQGLRAFLYRTAGAEGLVAQALSGLEIAIWDAFGKASGRSLSHLLGRRRDKVPLYAGGTLTFSKPLDWYGSYFDDYLRRGVAAVKVRIGRSLEWDLSMVQSVRRYIGEKIALLVDAKYNYTASSAQILVRRLAPLKPYLLEEPVPTYERPTMRNLAALGLVPIAYGENITSIHGFRSLIEDRAANVLQPDGTIVGVDGFRRVAAMASAAGLILNPHSGGLSAIGIAANLHLCAALADSIYLEYDIAPEQPLRDEIIEAPLFSPEAIRQGCLPVPDGPGLGIEVKEETFARFPYQLRPPAKENPDYGMPHI